ncbi:unnamed protein product [Dracunculus medinensis]|uniref:FBO_C domain-containing protein n=1 Tax=Dracunculus medinensis TaxID=318479 RepID=A0A0N4U6E9_DRAME|nr:unnamed protein product [Dracunculus medinensis]
MLICFRENWKFELDKNRKDGVKIVLQTSNRILTEEEKYEKASTLFLEGVELEQRGEMCEAVHRYTNAIRLVPDIEFKVFRNATKKTSPKKEIVDHQIDSNLNLRDFVIDFNMKDALYQRVMQREMLIMAAAESNDCHISKLPIELLMKIVKHSVGIGLDSFFSRNISVIFNRDNILWHGICLRIFDAKRVELIEGNFANWRHMFISCPHLYFHGVYIGKCTYFRPGEASFQDNFYRPWHIITYYRFMRFFADGVVIMVTSSDPPVQIVSALKSKSTRLNGVLFGRYWSTTQGRIAAEFHRKSNGSQQKLFQKKRFIGREFFSHEIIDQKFYLELRFGSGRKRSAHCTLHWDKYDCTFTYLDGNVSTNSFNVNDRQAFPSFSFSRVKSFAIPEMRDIVA